MDNYLILRSLGSGSFGSVFLARHLPTGEFVALKKVRIKQLKDGLPRVLLREIQALEKLSAEHGSTRSRHVLRLREYFPQGASVVLVLEYCIADLHMVLQSLATAGRCMERKAAKLIMWMAVNGIAGVHEQNVIHRDLKPSNLLFSPSGCLKLGDFGLARIHAKGASDPTYSHEVATRWYRSPELLFGARKYGGEVDLWALGCIHYELLAGQPLFTGQNDIDQLYRVLKVLGTPNAQNYPDHSNLPDWGKIDFPSMEPVDLKTLLPDDTPDDAVDLLRGLLTLDPKRRMTANQARDHAYFAELRHAREKPLEDPHALEWMEEKLLELATFPSLLRQYQQLQEQSPAKPSKPVASQSSTSSNPSASASNSTSSFSPMHEFDAQQLRAMHLSGIEWQPLSSSSLMATVGHLPASQLTLPRLHQPFTIDDVCSS